ncbi:hypothetical protein OPV22_014170 [Ensete ventricosum]|uniref:Pyruvate decarboxylase n=1 Tax=Ensete ventricosum TaxID=4639 RepID=A0AAV8R2N3_ENSVE|nr:hypothetical protein OPV22_014170 [Ensete ventricosum]
MSTALKESKPVYVSISCNLPGIPMEPVPYFLAPKVSNQLGVEAAVKATAEFLNQSRKAGVSCRSETEGISSPEGSSWSWPMHAIMPSAKGMVTAQDVSTMIRHGQRCIIFLIINNGGYTIEMLELQGEYRRRPGRGHSESDRRKKKDCLCFIE